MSCTARTWTAGIGVTIWGIVIRPAARDGETEEAVQTTH
jgi:hypothetical protein